MNVNYVDWCSATRMPPSVDTGTWSKRIQNRGSCQGNYQLLLMFIYVVHCRLWWLFWFMLLLHFEKMICIDMYCKHLIPGSHHEVLLISGWDGVVNTAVNGEYQRSFGRSSRRPSYQKSDGSAYLFYNEALWGDVINHELQIVTVRVTVYTVSLRIICVYTICRTVVLLVYLCLFIIMHFFMLLLHSCHMPSAPQGWSDVDHQP